MPDRLPIPKFLLGTALKFTVILDTADFDSISSVKITIDDPSEVEKVSDITMEQDSDKVYSYVWQSLASYQEGDYIATIEVVLGSYTSVKQEKFTLVEQE
jgi:hypothetical protein